MIVSDSPPSTLSLLRRIWGHHSPRRLQLAVLPATALGWRARIPLAEGLTSTVALYRQALAQQQFVRL